MNFLFGPLSGSVRSGMRLNIYLTPRSSQFPQRDDEVAGLPT
jgi:hypothetical protein